MRWFIGDVGSHPDLFGPVDREEAVRDAVRLAIDDQLRAGLDRISDGEMQRVEFNLGFYEYRGGLPSHRCSGNDAGKVVERAGFRVRAVPAAHERIDRDERGGYLYLECVIETEGLRLYHSGDSLAYDGLAEELGQKPFDVLFPPINGRDPARGVRGNMTATEGDQEVSVTLGIDIGTSGTKTLAIDDRGTILASALAEYPCSHPNPGWSEQDPELWWDATIKTVQSVLAAATFAPADVKGIGLSGQMHGSVFLDQAGAVIRPALLWNDQRTAVECREIEERAGGREALVKMVANPALTGFTAPKLLWVRRVEPANWDRVRQVLLPKDYVRYRLTGAFATEVSDASGTLLLDVVNRRWSRELLGKLEIDPSLLPPCYESPEVSSVVSETGFKATGVPKGTPVVGGGGDQPAGAVGNGIVRQGVVSAMIGTSGVVFAHADQPGFDPLGRLQRGCHAVPGAWHVMGVVLCAGGSFQWFRDELGKAEVARGKEQGLDPYYVLTAEAALAGPGAEGLFFLPYLTGERTPHFDPDAKGGWIGLTIRHGRPHLIRALLEGATFAMRDSLELIREMGVSINQIRLSGGGARNPLWRQIQADIYGGDVHTLNSSDGPAFGAALLAQVGTGAFRSVPEACDATIRTVESTAVDPKVKAFYDKSYVVYQKLYRDLRESFRSISELVAHPSWKRAC
ncbi:MAG: xylulokinase [Isosphaeraceae bacterium]